jgi:glycosyltransferase involved in cell wall biosynthesis
MRPAFSIVIPTRDRKSTLGPCIAGCLLQDHPNFEIVVQDNASTDGTADVMASITDPRVKYFRTGQRTSMRGNFENAVGNAQGDNIIMIGDDDGMVPGALKRLDALLQPGDVEFISWPTLYYFWPGADPTGAHFGLTLKRNGVFGANEVVSGGDIAKALGRAEPVHFRRVPKLYHGCMSRRLIERISAKTNAVFLYDIPDLYVQAAGAMVGAKGLSLLHPASINGGSANSTGGGQFGNTSGKLDENPDTSFGKFITEAKQDKIAPVPFSPYFASTDYYTYVSLVIAAEAFGSNVVINHDAWTQRVVRQLSQNASILRIAKNAKPLSKVDERVIAALANVPMPEPTVVQPVAPKIKKKRSGVLSKCRLQTAVNGVDNVTTATQVLADAFGSRHTEYMLFPGWQAKQLVRWGQMLAAAKARVVS